MSLEGEANELVDLLFVLVYMTVGGTARCFPRYLSDHNLIIMASGR